MALLPISHYARELRPHLPPEIFAAAPARLLWLALHLSVIVLGFWALAAGGLSTPVKALISVPLGFAFAGMTFVAHETLHGAIVRSMPARRLIGWVSFLPFLISPRHWVGWHNRLHHGHTTVEGIDPDGYPTLETYHAQRLARVGERFSFGGRRLLGVASLLIGLTMQSLHVLVSSGPRNGYLSRREHALAIAETLAALAVWVGLGIWLGAGFLVFAWLVPLAIGSVVVMAHIITNHNLSQLTDVNDPLGNSLTVTSPRWFSDYTMQFGFHVEHHLFPAISARHAPRIRALIVERWPERYQSLPLWSALSRLFTTGRVYKDATTLIDPSTGVESATL